jgi:putative transposase
LVGKSSEEMAGPEGWLKQFTKALLERAMKAELTHPLGYEKHEPAGRGSGNSRNGQSRKTVPGDFGAVAMAVPRDRNGSFAPKILPQHERRLAGFDDKILSRYARGMTRRDIQRQLEEMDGVEVSPSLIREVMDEGRVWQSRPRESLYALLSRDARMGKRRHEGRVENRAVFVARGVSLAGQKEVLGL